MSPSLQSSLIREIRTLPSNDPPSCTPLKMESTALVSSSDSPLWISITRPNAVARIVSMVKEP